jgi:hypothetical protein
MNVFKSIIVGVLFSNMIFSKGVHAQVKSDDLYRQLGGIGALYELCFKKSNIEQMVFAHVSYVYQVFPEEGRAMYDNLDSYFEGKYMARGNQRIWIARLKDYNATPLKCKNKEDAALIKKMYSNFFELLYKGDSKFLLFPGAFK